MSVYFVQAGESGPIKIGYAREIEGRLSDLQCASPLPLFMRAAILGAPQKTEGALHRCLRPWRERREWFKPVHPITTLAAKVAANELDQDTAVSWAESISRRLKVAEEVEKRLHLVTSLRREIIDPLTPRRTVAQCKSALAILGETLESNPLTFSDALAMTVHLEDPDFKLKDLEGCRDLLENARDAIEGLLATLKPRDVA